MPTATYGPFLVNNKRVNTKVRVKAGDRIGIVASGEVDFGGAVIGIGAPVLDANGDDWETPPDYPAPNLRKNSLICDIGGTFFQGGVNTSFTSTADGVLILQPNDKDLKDNSRGWRVIVYHSFPDPVAPGVSPQPVPDPIRGSWWFYTLDGEGGIFGPDCGYSPSAVLFNGRLHVFHGELSGDFNLRHLDFDPLQEWVWAGGPPPAPDRNIEVLDGDGEPNGRTARPVGWTTLAIVHNNAIHVFYPQITVEGFFALRHATFNGSTWAFAILDGLGGTSGRVNGDVVRFIWSTLSAVSVSGELHLFYFGLTDRDRGPGPDGSGQRTGVLRHARLSASGTWRFEVLDGEGGPNGRLNALAGEGFVGHTSAALVDRNGRMHVFYSHALVAEGQEGATNLRHAWSDDGTNWQFETLDGQGGPDGRIRAHVGLFPTAIEFENKIYVFYYDSTYENVRYGVFDGNRWYFEALDGTGGKNGRVKANVGGAPMAAAKLDDQLSLFYWDSTNGNLRHAFWKGVNWQFETLDGEWSDNFGRISAAVGWRTAALAVTPRRMAVFYRDASSTDLRYAEFK